MAVQILRWQEQDHLACRNGKRSPRRRYRAGNPLDHPGDRGACHPHLQPAGRPPVRLARPHVGTQNPRHGPGQWSRDRRADPDSRARTHLANERTFLAWLRTGLSLVALGLGAAQFLSQDLIPGIPIATIFALFLVVSGMAMAVVGGAHYLHARSEIEHGAFLPSTRVAVMGIAVALGAGVLAAILVVLLHLNA
jgi:putative membrane protein